MLAWLEGGGRVEATYERGGVSGLTLLMLAAKNSHERVVELLMQHGAEVDKKDSNGGTALMHAAGQGRERVVELLLWRGAKVNQQDSNGCTALMAAANGHEQVVDLLIRHGAEVNLQDSNGGTALMYAGLFNHPAVVLRMLRAGADTAARSVRGSTAQQLAKEKGHAECVKVLSEAATAVFPFYTSSTCPPCQPPFPHCERRKARAAPRCPRPACAVVEGGLRMRLPSAGPLGIRRCSTAPALLRDTLARLFPRRCARHPGLLRATLDALFTAPHLLKLGFGLRDDLKELRR